MATYDQPTALARLQRMVQSAIVPTLDTASVADLLTLATVADVDGRQPGTTGYVPTYSDGGLRRAAAEGWAWKAGKVAAEYEVSTGSGKNFKRDQTYAHCVTMSRHYGGGSRLGSVTVG